MTNTDDALWDANDVARYLKVSRSWVYHHAEVGKLPCIKIGGLLRFAPAQIRALVGAKNADTNVVQMKRVQPNR